MTKNSIPSDITDASHKLYVSIQHINTQNTAFVWLTANTRLARYVHRYYEQQLEQSASLSAIFPHCLPWKNWIASVYESLGGVRLLLSLQQEHVLWEQIIAHTLTDMRADWALLPTFGLAKKARDAFVSLKSARCELSALRGLSETEESLAFHRWATEFIRICKRSEWIDFATCTDVVTAAILQGSVALPTTIILSGFEMPSQQLKALFSALAKKSKVSIENHLGHALKRADCRSHQVPHKLQADTKQVPPAAQKIVFENTEAELFAMAKWAQKMQGAHSGKAIICVVPKLDTHRPLVVRIFQSLFLQAKYYNISGGAPLCAFPLIQSALTLLKSMGQIVPMEDLSLLLRTPFLGGALQEFGARGQLLAALQALCEPKVTWQTVQSMAKKAGDCPLWTGQVSLYLTSCKQIANPMHLHDWARYFRQQLQSMGWPGNRTLDSAEYQQLQRFEKLLEMFCQLQCITAEKIRYKSALCYLQQLAGQALFQHKPESAVHHPIEVLGKLEAIGLPADYMWVANMDDSSWPEPLSYNPFIPVDVQRDYQMPRSSPERELAYASALLKHLCQSAPHVLLSYAKRDVDTEKSASMLLTDIKELSKDALEIAAIAAPKEPLLNKLEDWCDDYGPGWVMTQKAPGGARLFARQAACPFQAFAVLRLDAKSIPEAQMGLTQSERGNYMHRILERVWGKLRDQQTLLQLPYDSLDALLKNIIDIVLQSSTHIRPFSCPPALLAIEKVRLLKSTQDWLAVEKQRTPFVVRATEQSLEVNFKGLLLTLRMDREDELVAGGHLVIDYKTGKCDLKDWFTSRPDAPQMPLYGLVYPHPPAGLLFAQIVADTLQFKGIVDDQIAVFQTNSVPIGKKQLLYPLSKQPFEPQDRSWEAFYKRQLSHLGNLAEQFINGYAEVAPKSADTCKICDLQSFCRKSE